MKSVDFRQVVFYQNSLFLIVNWTCHCKIFNSFTGSDSI